MRGRPGKDGPSVPRAGPAEGQPGRRRDVGHHAVPGPGELRQRADSAPAVNPVKDCPPSH